MAVFASGRGSNAKALIDFSKLENSTYGVSLIISNKKSAKVLELAHDEGIPTAILTKKGFYHSQDTIELLKKHNIEVIALAGFLWLIPQNLLLGNIHCRW